MAQMASRFWEELTMGNTAHDLALGDARVDRGPARCTARDQTSPDFSAIMNRGSTPDRRATNDRRRTLAKAIPLRMAGSAFGWPTLIAPMTAARLAALLVFSSILQF
jgi:hypothetical protein